MSILQQTVILLLVQLWLLPCFVHGWFWSKYEFTYCEQRPIQQLFCANNRLYAIIAGEIHYGPYCRSLTSNSTLRFDRKLETNGLVDSAFFDKHRHLFLLKNDKIHAQYSKYLSRSYNVTDLLVHFDRSIEYFVYHEEWDTLFVITKDQHLVTFNQHILTNKNEVRWGFNATEFKRSHNIAQMKIEYFFFTDNDLIVKVEHHRDHFAIPNIRFCYERRYKGNLKACLDENLFKGIFTLISIRADVCRNLIDLIFCLLILFLILFLILLILFICLYKRYRQQGETWNVAKKEKELEKKILSRLSKSERKLLSKNGDLLSKFAKHKFQTDYNNNDVPDGSGCQLDNDSNERKEKNNLLYRADSPTDPYAPYLVDNESLLSSIHVEDFQENRPDIDLTEPARPIHKLTLNGILV